MTDTAPETVTALREEIVRLTARLAIADEDYRTDTTSYTQEIAALRAEVDRLVAERSEMRAAHAPVAALRGEIERLKWHLGVIADMAHDAEARRVTWAMIEDQARGAANPGDWRRVASSEPTPFNPDDICVCGHTESRHRFTYSAAQPCYGSGALGCPCIVFRLALAAPPAVLEPATATQPAPTGDGAEVWPLVIQDMQARDQLGRERYGTPLRAHNGRDALVDRYQELLDACVYARQEIYERDGR